MKWVVIILVGVAICTVAAVVVAGRLGFIEPKAMLASSLKQIGAVRPYVEAYELGVKHSKTLARQRQALADERQALDLKIKELAAASAQLETRRQTVEDELAQIEAKRNALLKVVSAAERLDRVAKLCTAVPPGEAAKLLAGLGDPEVVQVLARLTDKQASQVLLALDPRRAARLVVSMTRP